MIRSSRNLAKRILFDLRDPSLHAAKVNPAVDLTQLQDYQSNPSESCRAIIWQCIGRSQRMLKCLRKDFREQRGSGGEASRFTNPILQFRCVDTAQLLRGWALS